MDDEERKIIEAIDGRRKLEVYLMDKPVEWSQIIALRSSLRIFPLFLRRKLNRLKHTDELLPMIHAAWRAKLISILAQFRPSTDVKIASVHAADAIANSARIAYSKLVTLAAEAAADAAYASTAGTSDREYAASRAASASSFAARSADDVGHIFWFAIRNDLVALSNDENIFPTHLFPDVNSGDEFNREIVGLRTELRQMVLDYAKSDLVKGTHWEIISDWSMALSDTTYKATPWGNQGSDIDEQIALKPKEFWDRDPDAVMYDIANIVGWPNYAQEKSNDEDLVIAKNATKFPETLEELKQEQMGFGYSLLAEFPDHSNIFELNSYLDILEADEPLDFEMSK